MPSQKVKGVSSDGIIIVFVARIDDLIVRWVLNYVRVPAGGITLGTGVYRRVRFRSCGTVGYGPTMWLKVEKGPTSCMAMIARHVRG